MQKDQQLLKTSPDDAALLVGDVDQLPFFGSGRVLTDVIGSFTSSVLGSLAIAIFRRRRFPGLGARAIFDGRSLASCAPLAGQRRQRAALAGVNCLPRRRRRRRSTAERRRPGPSWSIARKPFQEGAADGASTANLRSSIASSRSACNWRNRPHRGTDRPPVPQSPTFTGQGPASPASNQLDDAPLGVTSLRVLCNC